ncbi:MAG: asparagine synthetase B, partial [Bacteroidales bacterium]|nr:asparagine synthetase B [Bacteroidales bacterium]
MSAIFGIIDFEGRPLKEEWIQSMQRGLAHRGPDGQGLYREPSVALGHMLLQVTPESIYDKSPYEEDGLVITADARLDEREAIMDRIGTPQSERDKITDPLLLLRSYKKFGKDFVKDIYGDFAFAIWDKNKRELFCARDQMGVKPFLYYYKDGRFVFSTEIKAIVKLELVNTEIDQIY